MLLCGFQDAGSGLGQELGAGEFDHGFGEIRIADAGFHAGEIFDRRFHGRAFVQAHGADGADSGALLGKILVRLLDNPHGGDGIPAKAG